MRPHVKTHKVMEVSHMVQKAADAAGVTITGVVASTVSVRLACNHAHLTPPAFSTRLHRRWNSLPREAVMT